MKKCNNINCKQNNPQPFENFFKDRNSSDGYCYDCKSCRKIYLKNYKKNNKEKVKLSYRNQNLMKSYGLHLEEYNLLLINQENKCAICGIDKNFAGKRGLVVDHIHIKNYKRLKSNDKKIYIRGLLCQKCNLGIGMFNEDIDILEKAKLYLKER